MEDNNEKLQKSRQITESRLEAFHKSRNSTNLRVIGVPSHGARGLDFCANLLLDRDGIEKVKSVSILLSFPDFTFLQSLGKG